MEQNEFTKRIFRNDLGGLDAYSRHKKYVTEYLNFYGTRSKSRSRLAEGKTDVDVLIENHKFLRDPEEDANLTWEQRVAQKYYNKLFKEYAIIELKYYRVGKIAMRWRTQKEVISGKGQFVCASTSCEEINGLKSWEVNFAYQEHGERKNALVKVRLCEACSNKLNYKRQAKLARRKRHRDKREEEGLSEREKEKGKRRRKGEEEEDEVEGEDKRKSEETAGQEEEKQKEDADNIWTRTTVVAEKTRDEEFDEYLEGIFDDLLS
ncbi:uncharacterized protein VTP21DRAFT_10592 [Calcarisporiella thermophila]|uniref:uncharacterized protein n=1 Tax=Calcarisporiella thermophila TaxID=911321 RepID=UPI003742E8DA